MITLIALLRIVPYFLAGLLAYQKGYKRLSVAMVYVIILALTNYLFDIPSEATAIASSIFALLIGWHAADLRPRRR